MRLACLWFSVAIACAQLNDGGFPSPLSRPRIPLLEEKDWSAQQKELLAG